MIRLDHNLVTWTIQGKASAEHDLALMAVAKGSADPRFEHRIIVAEEAGMRGAGGNLC